MKYRIVHLSDIHVWGFPPNPLDWLGKRTLGLGNLLLRRGRKFRQERLPDLVSAVDEDRPDHLLLAGDLTTTSLPSEFRKVRSAFGGRLVSPENATVIPGNHDRYTRSAWRRKDFDRYFGHTGGNGAYPFHKTLTPGLELIGFDPCLPHPISARGLASTGDVELLRELLAGFRDSETRRLLFACHYPGEVPEPHRSHERGHEMIGAPAVIEALSVWKGPIFWLHGHIHHAWRLQSPSLPNLVYLNPGAPLLRRRGVVSLGRWVLDWDGASMRAEWRSSPEAAGWIEDFD